MRMIQLFKVLDDEKVLSKPAIESELIILEDAILYSGVIGYNDSNEVNEDWPW